IAGESRLELDRPRVLPRRARPRAVVVDEDLDRTEPALRLLDRPLAAVHGRDIGGHPKTLQRLRDPLDLLLRPRDDRHAGTFACEGLGDRETYARCRRGDERDLAFDAEVHSRILVTCCRPPRSTKATRSRPGRRPPCCWFGDATPGSSS